MSKEVLTRSMSRNPPLPAILLPGKPGVKPAPGAQVQPPAAPRKRHPAALMNEMDAAVTRGVARGASKDYTIISIDDDSDDDVQSTTQRRKPKNRKRQRQEAPSKHRGGKSDPNSPSRDVVLLDDNDVTLDAKIGISAREKRRRLKSSDDEVEVLGTKMVPCRVLDVFPDAEITQVQALMTKWNDDVEKVIYEMIDVGYTKVAPSARSTASTGVGQKLLASSTDRPKKWSYDFMSAASFVPSDDYFQQAKNQLMFDFPFLSKVGVTLVLGNTHRHYALAHEHIFVELKGAKADKAGESLEDAQYQRVLRAFSAASLDASQTKRLEKVAGKKGLLKKPRKNPETPPDVTEGILEEEIRFVRRKIDEFMTQGRIRRERQRKNEAAQATNTGLECPCCFEVVHIDEMVSCRDEGHLFCSDCLKSVAEQAIFGAGNLGIDVQTKKPALDLKCFHSDGCSSVFSRALLQKALPPKTMDKYDEMQYRINMDAAGQQDLCSCPKCGFQAALPASQKIFACPVDNCHFESCRSCGEAAHIPLRCEEVEKEVETKGRLTVEEAISAARIRKCPKCHKGFIKSDGCNKISCGCGTKVCYVCSAVISDYSHFCQVPHCAHRQCTKCPLYTKDEDDEARAIKAGAAAAKLAAEKAGVNVDLDSILRLPTAVAAKK